MLRYIPSIPTSIRVFIINGCCWILSNALSVSVEMTIWFLSFVDVVYHIYLCMLNFPSDQPYSESNLVMVHELCFVGFGLLIMTVLFIPTCRLMVPLPATWMRSSQPSLALHGIPVIYCCLFSKPHPKLSSIKQHPFYHVYHSESQVSGQSRTLLLHDICGLHWGHLSGILGVASLDAWMSGVTPSLHLSGGWPGMAATAVSLQAASSPGQLGRTVW